MAAGSFDPRGTDRRILLGFGTRAVMMARTVSSSVEEVWTALTDADRLSQWLGTPQGRLELTQMFTLYGATCEIVVCRPPHRLDLSWTRAGETNTLRVGVSSRPGGTEVVLEHAGIRNLALVGYGPSWEERLAHLEEHLCGLQVPQHDCRELELTLRPLWSQHLPPDERPAA